VALTTKRLTLEQLDELARQRASRAKANKRSSRGPRGRAGETGSGGTQGSQGERGLTGETGPIGAKGSIGEQGRQGDKGFSGDDGETGPQGAKGIDGIDGKDGDPGLDGVDGSDGKDGSDGAIGPVGAGGIDGLGIQGIPGDKGDKGEEGPKGPKGDKGDPAKEAKEAVTNIIAGGTPFMPRNKRDATTFPGITDDQEAGYLVGSRWWDITSGTRAEDVCMDKTTGAAVWKSTTASSDASYLVGSPSDDLSNEIVGGETPGGELGGTWNAPIVDFVHSGSQHHDTHETILHSELTSVAGDGHTSAAHGHEAMVYIPFGDSPSAGQVK